MNRLPSRRRMLQTGAAVAAASVFNSQASAQPAADATSRPAPTPDVPPAAPAWMTADDIGVLDKLTDQNHPPELRAQIARGLNNSRNAIRTLRSYPIHDGTTPSFHFTPFIPGIAEPPRVEAQCVPGRREPIAYDGNVESLAFASVADLHDLLMARKVTSVQLTEMFLARIRRLDPTLKAIITLTDQVALEQARRADDRIAAGETGFLLGIPYGLKDLFATRGFPMTMGALPLKDQLIDDDATLVTKLRNAGAVMLGKTSLGEMGMGNVWFGGATKNPWNTALGSSGSSAGSASGVAAGLYPFAIGTETNGSIVSPCMVCGTTGLRPTFGRVNRGGGAALAWTMDKIGVITRRVEDAALCFHAMHGPSEDPQGNRDTSYRHVPFAWDGDLGLEGIRIGIDAQAFRNLRSDTENLKESADAYKEAAAKLEAIYGKPLTPVELPSSRDYAGLIALIVNCEGSAAFTTMRRTGGLEKLERQLDGSFPNMFRFASMIPAVDYLRAMQVRGQLQLAMDKAMGEVDVYLSTPYTSPTVVYNNLCGQPTVITRCGRRANGMPFSIQFVAKLDREDLALRVALAFERATKWHTYWPEI